jgi:hypothetical protein
VSTIARTGIPSRMLLHGRPANSPSAVSGGGRWCHYGGPVGATLPTLDGGEWVMPKSRTGFRNRITSALRVSDTAYQETNRGKGEQELFS